MSIFAFIGSMFLASQSSAYLKTQSGAYNGLLSSGIGIETSSSMVESTIGWTPNLGGEATVQLNLKSGLKSKSGVYGGLGLLVTNDKDTFYTLPEQYPANYYAPTGFHFSLFAGYKVDGFFVEFSTIDYYLEVKARNSNYIKWQDIVSTGFGYAWDL